MLANIYMVQHGMKIDISIIVTTCMHVLYFSSCLVPRLATCCKCRLPKSSDSLVIKSTVSPIWEVLVSTYVTMQCEPYGINNQILVQQPHAKSCLYMYDVDKHMHMFMITL